MTTAAILVIGNEILSGKIRDENSPWLAERLRAAGVDLKRILVLPDEESLLAQHIAELSGRFDHVFTSGGIGPTHDDCTMAAVASAFQMKLHHQEALINALHNRVAPADRDTSRFRAMKRMCLTPEGAVLWHSPELYFPLVVVQNVVILPGVPHLFRKKFLAFADRFTGVPVQTRRLFTNHSEANFADQLEAIQKNWPAVEIGSYPQRTDEGWRTMLTLDSRSSSDLTQCAQEVAALLNSVVEPS